MKKTVSIRAKITLWFTVILIAVVLVSYLAVITASRQVIQKTIRDSLIETVENNVDEVEFYENTDEMPEDDVDSYLLYGTGYLEIDDDFLDAVNEVYTTIYTDDGDFVYGENPISSAVDDLTFQDETVQRVKVDGTLYYIFDRQLEEDGLEGLWLRGVVSETQGDAQLTAITRILLIVLPFLVIVACIGGYIIAGRALRPVKQISDTAKTIRDDGDLQKRITLSPGRDELHELADTFNEMFDTLEASFDTQRRFISDASHELRTPMTVILAQCELSLEETRESEEYEQALQVIRRQSRRMSRLINDMLDFTRLEVSAERYPLENLALTGLVSSLCEDMALIREKGITLRTQLQEDIRMNGNAQLLTRMLANLISNAYRYGRENGHILVKLSAAENCIHLSVTDDGIGIPAGEQQRIFERFYQADSSRSGEGMGLGLSMAAEIARFHGGTISVESTPGRGSVFTVRLWQVP